MKTPLGKVVAAGVLWCATLAAQPPQPQPSQTQPPVRPQPEVTFRVEINYVEVDVVVTDAQGNFVRDLTVADFQVLEDGKLQAVSTFALVDIPIERAERPLFATRPIEPDVQSNRRGLDGRVYVLVLDDLHTHALRSERVRRAARQFIERNLGANDRVALVYTSGRTDASQDFTSNSRLLLAAVDKFMGRKLRSSTLERIDEYYRGRDLRDANEPVRDPFDVERGFQARAALGTLKNLTDWMAGLRGRRKALIFFSEGIDYDIYDIFNARESSTVMEAARDAISAATRANVNIYTVDPRGLTQLADEGIEIAGLPDDPSLNLGPGSLQSELRLAQDSLRVLADETGGFAALNSNDFSQAFDRVVRENSSYYVIGYYPTNTRRDGKLRKIDVRTNHPGLVVRARRGYVAPRGRAPEPRPSASGTGPSTELREALDSPLPIAGLEMSAFAAAFKGAPPKAAVVTVVQVSSRDLTFADRNGTFASDLELSVLAIDQQGKLQDADQHGVNMGLRPDTYARVAKTGIRLVSRLEVPPGRYQLRIGVREKGSGRVGSVHYDLEVPDFGKPPLSMSGLVVTSAQAGQTPTGRVEKVPELEPLPGPPTTVREFMAEDELALFAEVYDNEPGRPHKVDITTTMRSDEGREVFRNAEERGSEELQRARGGYGYTAGIPLRDLSPGLYVLRVEARSRLGDGPSAAREVLLRIR